MGKSRRRAKVLYFDGTGLVLLTERLFQARFARRWPDKRAASVGLIDGRAVAVFGGLRAGGALEAETILHKRGLSIAESARKCGRATEPSRAPARSNLDARHLAMLCMARYQVVATPLEVAPSYCGSGQLGGVAEVNSR